MRPTETTFVDTVSQIRLSEREVVVADNALPNAILQQLNDPIVVDAGESLKSLARIEVIAQMILERRAERPLTIVAVGGGSIGDAIGFIASVLWRGVGLIHVPTTLLAMVDSAHGGKTAVNLGVHKNQLGSFYPAERVYIVREIIDELPYHLRTEGLAEVVKSAWLDSAEFVNQIRTVDWHDTDQLVSVIRKTIAFKNRVVAEDPYDNRDVRIQLNLGHTAAHGLERVAELSHGEAVAWGLAASALLRPQHQTDGMLQDALRLVRPTSAVRTLPEDQFCAAVAKDKKKKDGTLRSLFVTKPGRFEIDSTVEPRDWYRAVLNAHNYIDGPATIELQNPNAAHDTNITLPPAKSEAIRALCIDPQLRFTNPCDDVFFTQRALGQLNRGARVVDIGEGAAPFRFLATRAAFTRDDSVTFRLGPTLNARNHAALVEALRDNGVESNHDKARCLFEIACRPRSEVRYDARAAQTSQVASAFLLLRAVGIEADVTFDDQTVSRPYFEMTKQMLATDSFVDSDAGAYAFWMILKDLGFNCDIANPPRGGRQSDAGISDVLSAAKTSGTVSLKRCPDLGPVLGAWAYVSETPLRVTDASHLRNKESDRLGGLVASLQSVGANIVETDDGFQISPSNADVSNRSFKTFEDHRMVMAAAIVATQGAVKIDSAGCVSKSYPGFWRAIERVGLRVSYTGDL